MRADKKSSHITYCRSSSDEHSVHEPRETSHLQRFQSTGGFKSVKCSRPWALLVPWPCRLLGQLSSHKSLTWHQQIRGQICALFHHPRNQKVPKQLSDKLPFNLMTVECALKPHLPVEYELLAGLLFTFGSILQNWAAFHSIIESASSFCSMGWIGKRPVHCCLDFWSPRFCFSFHRNLGPAAEEPAIWGKNHRSITSIPTFPHAAHWKTLFSIDKQRHISTLFNHPSESTFYFCNLNLLGCKPWAQKLIQQSFWCIFKRLTCYSIKSPNRSFLTHFFPHAEGIWIVFCNFKPAMISRPSGRRQTPPDSASYDFGKHLNSDFTVKIFWRFYFIVFYWQMRGGGKA